MNWSECAGVEQIEGKVSGAPVFIGTRLPVEAITENIDAFMEVEGQSLKEAIASTLECFPETPGGADGIRAILAYRASDRAPASFLTTKTYP